MKLSQVVSLVNAGLSEGNEPAHLEHCNVAGLHWVNIVQIQTESLISQEVFTGFSEDYPTALSKAVSEKIERLAFREGYGRGLQSCQTERSDGFAALPVFVPEFRSEVRATALNEAIERFAWATWWDDLSIHYDYKQFCDLNEPQSWLGQSGKLLKELGKELELKKLHLISPFLSGYPEHEVLIFIAELDDGVITGGASGRVHERSRTILRALSELFRHGQVLVQNKTHPKILSFYEKRLLYFASPDGLSTFRKRLTENGDFPVSFGPLAIDEEVPHDHRLTHIVYRCLFRDQPPFIGGSLERMCL